MNPLQLPGQKKARSGKAGKWDKMEQISMLIPEKHYPGAVSGVGKVIAHNGQGKETISKSSIWETWCFQQYIKTQTYMGGVSNILLTM